MSYKFTIIFRMVITMNRLLKKAIIFILCMTFTSSLVNIANANVTSSSENSKFSEIQKELPKEEIEVQIKLSKESKKRKKAYVVFFHVDESFLVGIYGEDYYDEHENILDMYTMENFDPDSPTKWSDFIDFLGIVKEKTEKLDYELFFLTGYQFEKKFPGRILC